MSSRVNPVQLKKQRCQGRRHSMYLNIDSEIYLTHIYMLKITYFMLETGDTM